jgi:hypothetical protein
MLHVVAAAARHAAFERHLRCTGPSIAEPQSRRSSPGAVLAPPFMRKHFRAAPSASSSPYRQAAASTFARLIAKAQMQRDVQFGVEKHPHTGKKGCGTPASGDP